MRAHPVIGIAQASGFNNGCDRGCACRRRGGHAFRDRPARLGARLPPFGHATSRRGVPGRSSTPSRSTAETAPALSARNRSAAEEKPSIRVVGMGPSPRGGRWPASEESTRCAPAPARSGTEQREGLREQWRARSVRGGSHSAGRPGGRLRQLSAADREAALEPDDLERLAMAAWPSRFRVRGSARRPAPYATFFPLAHRAQARSLSSPPQKPVDDVPRVRVGFPPASG
jgi:hypothetical protein